MQTKAFLEQLNSIAKTKKKQNLEHKNALLNVINLPDWRWFGAIFIRSTHTHTFDSWNNLITYGISQFSIRKKNFKKNETETKSNFRLGSLQKKTNKLFSLKIAQSVSCLLIQKNPKKIKCLFCRGIKVQYIQERRSVQNESQKRQFIYHRKSKTKTSLFSLFIPYFQNKNFFFTSQRAFLLVCLPGVIYRKIIHCPSTKYTQQKISSMKNNI